MTKLMSKGTETNMQNWLRRQNSFTKWTAIGTATSAAACMIAVAALVITTIAVLTMGQRSYFGLLYPPILDKIGGAALYIIGVSIAAFLIFAVGLIASLFVGTKTGQKQTED